MKKTLVALATLAAVSAYAQSTVVIDGYFDRGYRNVNNTKDTSDLSTVSSNAGTTTFGIKVREDLGGGLSVGGSVNTDWAEFGGASQANGVNTAQGAGFANSQSFVDVTGNFGTVRLGSPNTFTLTNATAVGSPAFSTGVGSAYSDQFSIANGMGTGATGYVGTVREATISTSTGSTGARAIRIANTVQYSSPSFNGISVHVGITPQNNNKTADSGNGNTVGVTEYALRYTAGPIDAMYTSIKYEIGSNGTKQYFYDVTAANPALGAATLSGTAGSTTKNTQNLLAATYQVMPALKLHGGVGTFTSNSDVYKGKSTQLGATYTMGAWDILAQIASVDDTAATTAGGLDRKMTGLGVNYNFSKTARAYVRYDDIDWASNQTAPAAGGSKQSRTAVGVSKSF